jgi:cold shock CspA family protein
LIAPDFSIVRARTLAGRCGCGGRLFFKTGVSMVGTVTRIVIEKGYGFISVTGNPKDIFFHCSALDSDLPFDEVLRGRRVTFSPLDTAKGPAAADIRPAT